LRFSRLITRSLAYYRGTNAAVAIGVAVATAVIVGSLLVGHSVTASVRDTALARLGAIDYALPGRTFFRRDLAADLAAQQALQGRLKAAAPAIVARGSVRNAANDAAVPGVNIIGVDAAFWGMFGGRSIDLAAGRSVAVNEALAHDLGASQGDALLLNAARPGDAPAGTLFARRALEDVLGSMRLQVAAVLPDDGLGGFSLSNETATPRNAFVAIDRVAKALRQQDRANTLLLAADGEIPDAELSGALVAAVTPADLGLELRTAEQRRYVSVQSESLVLSGELVAAVHDAADALGARAADTSVHLADTISKPGGAHIAYAVIAAVEPLEPFEIQEGSAELDERGILLNKWAANDLGAHVGDELRVDHLVTDRDGSYGTTGDTYTLRGIVTLTGPGADKFLVPDFRGMTDQATIDEWAPPFPVDLSRVTERDDEYWERYRAAPKAFLSAGELRRIWQGETEGGWVTSVRVQRPDQVTAAAFAAKLGQALMQHAKPADAGLAFRPVRRQALEASEGTQDYGTLFVSMSFFLVAAAMGLAGMLMRLSVQRRASEAGTLLACGFTGRAAMRALLWEGGVLALAGAAAGVPLGIVYADRIIRLLTGWFGSIGNARLWLHVDSGSVLFGALAGLAAGVASMWWAARVLGKSGVLDLLAGWSAMNATSSRGSARLAAILLIVSGCAGVVMLGFVGGTGAFFGGGAALLVAGLSASHLLLGAVLARRRPGLSMARLIARNAAANRGRSMLVIGLLAAACFVIVAVAGNTKRVSSAEAAKKTSGTGGFALRATSSVPIAYDFGTKSGRDALAFDPADEPLMEGVNVYPLLSSRGDDISCRNLAKTALPRVLGAGGKMIERGGFTVTTARNDGGNPWQALEMRPDDGTIPVFGDAESIRWQLHSKLGGSLELPRPAAEPVTLRVVGLISSSVLAGELVMSERNFRQVFPQEATPSYFLIETPPGSADVVAAGLRRNLGDMGLEVRRTTEILESLLAVQNTYIATFIALGGLGVVLGTLSLVVVLLRSALERRGEFALMLATGFGRRQLAVLLAGENIALLLAGMALGSASALIAVAPQIASAQSSPNWLVLGIVLAAVLATGSTSCVIAAARAVRGNLIQALREE